MVRGGDLILEEFLSDVQTICRCVNGVNGRCLEPCDILELFTNNFTFFT